MAVEDSVPGARSAIAAGTRTIGQVALYGPTSAPNGRTAQLVAAGAYSVATSWRELRQVVAVVTPGREAATAD